MFSLSQALKQCCVSCVGLPRKVLFKQVFVIRTHLKVHWVRSSLFLQLETSMGLLLSMQDDGGRRCCLIQMWWSWPPKHKRKQSSSFWEAQGCQAPPLPPPLSESSVLIQFSLGNRERGQVLGLSGRPVRSWLVGGERGNVYSRPSLHFWKL